MSTGAIIGIIVAVLLLCCCFTHQRVIRALIKHEPILFCSFLFHFFSRTFLA